MEKLIRCSVCGGQQNETREELYRNGLLYEDDNGAIACEVCAFNQEE